MFDDKILNSTKFAALKAALKQKETLLIENLWSAPKALIAALAQKITGKHILFLTGSSQEEFRFFHDLEFFSSQPILDFPSWETLPSENITPSKDVVGERYKVLKSLVSHPEPTIIITGLQAILQKLLSPTIFKDFYFSLKKGSRFSFEGFVTKLVEMGYQKKIIASDKGEFAVRGGLIDVFPVASPDPYRLEFWGDELDSLRLYDPVGQKSLKEIDQIEIHPALELEFLQKSIAPCSLLDYLGENTLLILDDLIGLEDRYATLTSLGGASRLFSSIEEFLERIQGIQKIFLTEQPVEALSEVSLLSRPQKNFYSPQVLFHSLRFELFQRIWEVKRWLHPFQSIQGYISSENKTLSRSEMLEGIVSAPFLKEGMLYFLTKSDLEEKELHKHIVEYEISLPSHYLYQRGYLSGGFVIEEAKLCLFPFTELTHRYKVHRPKFRSTYHSAPVEIYSLTEGDFVVHMHNGIGIYLGIEKRTDHTGNLAEFIVIEYAEGAKLYVPFHQSHLLTKYIGAHEEKPSLHTLGGTAWKKTREHTEKNIAIYASDLLRMQAQRSLKQGFAFPEDGELMRSFEEAFPFVETEDQLSAIKSIKQDMSSAKVMDRLVCGDVGYGKTEVAMRAAFKAVSDGNKQVAVLVPTTVLAIQHFETFTERMSHFPVKVGLLSRFSSSREIKETIKGVKEGNIDILIGTHRILSKDVEFKDLGLVIIDEEQRFGVKAKEHLKEIKLGVDCLTLSATPIPRTLYLSLIGARDMSLINTPPQDRLPIKTIITEPHREIIKNALLREFARDGQVFFIHNRVESIYAVASHLKEILPQIRILIVHGQLDTEEIEQAFHQFERGEADLLVATTIIENGIDIPNANTILINDAHHFGLPTLHQLRGRVGRWIHQAYAYFLSPSLNTLPPISRKKLQALEEASGYGAGMKIAQCDLSLRGAGNIVGVEQSGHISKMGFELYCKLLRQALKGNKDLLTDPRIDVAVDMRIPTYYIEEVALRLELYKRFGEATDLGEVDVLLEEIRDRFGKLPQEMFFLYHLTRVRIRAAQSGVTLLKQEKHLLTIEKQTVKGLSSKTLPMPKFHSPQELEEKLCAVF